MIWMVVPVARVVPCSLCGQGIPVPVFVHRADQIADLIDRHVAEHAAAALAAMAPRCARCQRYTEQDLPPADRLHRPCYGAECSCPCSYPEEG